MTSIISQDYWVTLTYSRILQLTGLVDHLSDLLPPLGPHKFAKALSQLLKAIKSLYDTFLIETDDPAKIEYISQTYISTVNYIHTDLLTYLEKGHIQDIPSELFPFLNTQIQNICKGRTDLAFGLFPSCDTPYEVAIYNNKPESIVRALASGKATADKVVEKYFSTQSIPRTFVFFSFHRIESRNALRHCMLFHELGHFVEFVSEAYKQLITPDMDVDISQVAKLAVKEKEDLTALLSPQAQLELFHDESMAKQFSERFLDRLNKWTVEIFADICAARMLGLSYLFTLFECAIITEGMERMSHFSDTHPSTLFRLQLLEEFLRDKLELDVEGLKNKDVAAIVTNIHEYVDAKYSPPTEDNFTLVCDTIRKNRHLIWAAALSIDTITDYKTPTYEDHTETIVSRYLLQGTAPIESYHKSSDSFIPWPVVSILGAGWVVYLTKLSELCDEHTVSSEEDKHKLTTNQLELLLTAVEASEILASTLSLEESDVPGTQ